MARGRPTNVAGLKKSQQAAKASRQRLQDRFREETREKFFKGRQDVSDDRLDRRRQQEKEYERFKRTQMKPVVGTGGTLFQSRIPGGPTLADKAQELALKYGPTPRELLGDIGYGIGSIAKGLAEKGTPMISLLRGISDKFKGGVRDVYDNLRNAFKGESQFTVPQAQGGIFEGQPIQTGPQFPYNFETVIKPRPEPLQPSEMSQEQFMESFPELYSQNPLFRQQEYKPFRVRDMDMSGVMASNAGQNIIGNLQNLQNLAQQYNLDKIQFDPFNSNRIGYKDQFMFNNTPVNYNLSVGDQGLQGGIQFAFKRGGSVDKHGGLGYKLK